MTFKGITERSPCSPRTSSSSIRLAVREFIAEVRERIEHPHSEQRAFELSARGLQACSTGVWLPASYRALAARSGRRHRSVANLPRSGPGRTRGEAVDVFPARRTTRPSFLRQTRLLRPRRPAARGRTVLITARSWYRPCSAQTLAGIVPRAAARPSIRCSEPAPGARVTARQAHLRSVR